MTDNTNITEEIIPATLGLPTTPEYQFAYVLATIHSTFLVGDMDRVHALIQNLPTALMDPKVSEIYLSDEVTTYLEWAYPLLFGEEQPDEEEFEPNPDMTEAEAEEFLSALFQKLFGDVEDDEDAFKTPELRTGCSDEECSCHDYEHGEWEEVTPDDDNEELLAETDEFVIVKIWK